MNLIRRIVQKLGFDIVKYSTPLLSSGNSPNNNGNGQSTRQPIISATLATEALSTVGRQTGVPVFTYYQRPDRSSPAMETAENLWWNEHGKLIEKVWVLSESVNSRYRQKYVSEALSFFKQENRKIKILDLGCGSGWFGRMIADADVEYHGIDFSSTQIEIANIEKEKSVNKDYLNYYCLTDFRQVKDLHKITGVVIHAFLHHLYWEELHKLFTDLVRVLPNGCKFFIIEPVYPDHADPSRMTPEVKPALDELVSGYRRYLQATRSDLIRRNLYDTKTENELNRVVSESAKNGFFFSPKEVPFKVSELTSFLKKYLALEGIFHSGVLNTETAQFIERINSKAEQEYHSKLLFPLVESLDEVLITSHYFEANKDTYLFTAFKCTLNRKMNEVN